MRDILRAMIEAGIKRSRFTAKFSGLSPRSHSILNNVMPPVGCIEHLWVQESLQLKPGSIVDFLATIKSYQREDLSRDYMLTDLEVIA